MSSFDNQFAASVPPPPRAEPPRRPGKPPKAPPPRRGVFYSCSMMLTGCFLGFLGLGLIFALGIFGLAKFSSGVAEALPGVKADNMVYKEIIRDGDANRSIAVIPLYGPIVGSDSYGEWSMVREITACLREAAKDEKVKAVILQVDSPGGGLTASDLLHQEVLHLQKAGKPVVACVGTMAASGGYWVIAPADQIVVSPTSIVGSFGVIMYRFKLKELMAKIGIEPLPEKSTPMKDLGSPFRDLTEKEKAIFTNLLSFWHQRFVEVIAKGRGLAIEKVEKLADGSIFTAPQAIRLGLADEEGYFDTALAKAEDLAAGTGARPAGAEKPMVFRYKHPRLLWEMFNLDASSTVEPASAKAVVDELLDRASTPCIEARWRVTD